MFSAAALTSLFVNLLKKMRIMYLFNLSRPPTLLGLAFETHVAIKLSLNPTCCHTPINKRHKQD